VLSVEDWAEIRRLRRAEQMPVKVIARVMGVSKNTVKRALAAGVCCVVPTRGVLTPLMSPDQIATASSAKANATRRSAGSSAASS
jgi:helix-turn-helix resolvase-like protein